ncbi:MAG: M1 family aminopeptidase [Bacteroidota bacterium]
MRTTALFIFLLFSGFLSAQVTFDPDMLNTIAKGERDIYARKSGHGARANSSEYKVTYYNCDWNINPAVREISGSVNVTFKPLTAGFDSLLLDMSQALVVDSVKYHNNILGSWIHSADILVARFANPLPQGIADSVRVFYHGVPPSTGFGSFVQSTHKEAPVIWTLSQPYGASDWWPCKNGLTDKADSIDIYISTPSAYKTASNGILVSAVHSGANIVYHWKHRYPIAAYLVALAVTNYYSFNQYVPFGSDTLKLVNFVYPEDSAAAVTELPVIVPMIQVFDSLFGIYPFQKEKYGNAEFGEGGGMEHQTMTFVNSFQFELISHELAHQWFGDKVTCGSWVDIWLNEGFATYLSGLIYEHLDPSLWKRFRQVRITQVTSLPGGSVYCTDTNDINRLFNSRLSYAKGALILHQLRWIMGDSVFFAALNNYLDDYSLAYGFARTENLVAHFESSYGHSLAWYFNEWFTGEGYPQYTINWTQTADTLSFTVRQTQSIATASFFELPLQIKLKNASRDTMIRVNNTFSGEMFKVRIPFTADSLVFDPECQLITANNVINAVEEHGLNAGLQVAPNPASDHVVFHFGGMLTSGHGSLCIYDDSGRMKEEFFPGSTMNALILDTRNYAPGLYFYVFSSQGKGLTGKFIIKH